MEDSKKSVTSSGEDARNENGVIELTPDMEIVSGRTPHIIDLTEVLQAGDEIPEPTPVTSHKTPPPAAGLSQTAAPVQSPVSVKDKITPDVDRKPPKRVEANSWEDILKRNSFAPPERPTPTAETAPPETPIALTDEISVEQEEVPLVDLEPADAGDTVDLTEPLVLDDDAVDLTEAVQPIDLVTEAEPPIEAAEPELDQPEPLALEDDAIEHDFPDLETADAGDTLDLVEVVHPADMLADEEPTGKTPVPEPQIEQEPAFDQTATLDELRDEDTIVLTDMVLPTEMISEPEEPANEQTESETAALDALDLDRADAGDTLNLIDVVNPIDLMAADPSGDEAAVEAPVQETASEEDDASWEDLTEGDTLMLTDMVLPSDLVDGEAPAPSSADGAPEDMTVVDDADEAPIELTDQIEPAADDVLELTEMVPPADTEAEPLPADDEVLDLTDMVLADEDEEVPTETAEDDVLELTEMIAPDETAPPVDEDETDIVDDEVLTLTDMVLADDDAETVPLDESSGDASEEEVLELTEMVIQEADGSVDEAPIELSDRVDTDTAMVEDDDGVIELMDIVDPETVAAELTAWQDTQVADTTADDDTIELTDIVSPQELAALKAAAVQGVGAQDQLIRLDSVLEQVRRNKDKIIADIAMDLEGNLPEGQRDALEKMAPINFNLDIDEIRAAIGETGDLDEKELQRVVEEIIRTKYSEAIEKAIGRAVEKAVTREMESIKRNLTEDLDPEKDE